MKRGIRLAALLLMLLLAMVSVPQPAEAASKSDFYGLWCNTNNHLLLCSDGTGVFGNKNTAYLIKWKLSATGEYIWFEGINGEYIPACCYSFKNSRKDVLVLDGFGTGSGSTYELKKTEVSSLSGCWSDGEEKLYLMDDGRYAYYRQDGNDNVYATGEWVNAGVAVYLLNKDSSRIDLLLFAERGSLSSADGSVTLRPTSTAEGSPCFLCGGSKRFMEDCSECNGGRVTCSACKGEKRRCSSCGGDGVAYTVKTYLNCTMCSVFGRNWNCSTCGGTGRYEYVKDKECGSCSGTGITHCGLCSNRGYVNCKKCSGRGGKMITCPCCGGSGKGATPTPKPTATPTPRPTATPGPRITFTQKNGASCSGAAWNAASPTCGKDVLKKLTRNYALEITFTASGNGHVWICLPQSRAGWTGIGQQNPIIRGNKVIIPYDTVVKAAGSSSSWGSQLYIKGNTEWKVTQIRVIYWPD